MFLRGFLAGMFAVLLTIVVVGMGAKAFSQEEGLFECDQSWFGLNTISHHFNPGRTYNEENWGVFYECERSRQWRWQAGYYLNSYERNTWYALALYQPIQGRWLGEVRVGGFFGLGTGYREREDVSQENGDSKDVPRNGLSALAGLMASWEPRRDFGANLLLTKSVVGLQLKLSWR